LLPPPKTLRHFFDFLQVMDRVSRSLRWQTHSSFSPLLLRLRFLAPNSSRGAERIPVKSLFNGSPVADFDAIDADYPSPNNKNATSFAETKISLLVDYLSLALLSILSLFNHYSTRPC
jgi:hypothetical protein